MSDPKKLNDKQEIASPLPSLSREALKRIEEAEASAKAQHEADRAPYFPMSPEFSFLEDSVYLCMKRTLEFIRI